MKKLILAAAVAILAACSAQQTANTQAKISSAVQVGCALDGKFVPIGQDAAAILAPAIGAANAPAGTLVMSALAADQALIHPAVVAVCKSLLGALAQPAAQVVPDAPVAPAPAPTVEAPPAAVVKPTV